MPIIMRRRDIADIPWPVTDSLHFLGFADNPNNVTFVDGPTIRMTLFYDESGNGRHATPAFSGEVWEADTSSQGLPCIRSAGERLRYNGGTPLVTDNFSVFVVTESDSNQTALTGATGREIELARSTNTNSPFIRNNVNGVVVQGASPLTYFDDYSDRVSRDWAFVYGDTANVRTIYVNGVLTNEDGDTGWTGTPAGSFDLTFIMGNLETGNLRMLAIAVYEGKQLNASEVLTLHNHIKNDLGLIA